MRNFAGVPIHRHAVSGSDPRSWRMWKDRMPSSKPRRPRGGARSPEAQATAHAGRIQAAAAVIAAIIGLVGPQLRLPAGCAAFESFRPRIRIDSVQVASSFEQSSAIASVFLFNTGRIPARGVRVRVSRQSGDVLAESTIAQDIGPRSRMVVLKPVRLARADSVVLINAKAIEPPDSFAQGDSRAAWISRSSARYQRPTRTTLELEERLPTVVRLGGHSYVVTFSSSEDLATISISTNGQTSRWRLAEGQQVSSGHLRMTLLSWVRYGNRAGPGSVTLLLEDR